MSSKHSLQRKKVMGISITILLWALFLGVLGMRVWFPHYFSPLDHLFSDPLRHWNHAQRLSGEYFMGGVDPKFYQWFLRPIYLWWQGERGATQWAIGILCSGTALVWYLAARELLTTRWALAAGILIGLTPSLLIIYGYFMTETLLLFMMGLAWWLSLVAWRKRSVIWFILAVAAWWGAILTRFVAFPPGMIVMIFLWWRLPRKWLTTPFALIVTAALLYPAAIYTKERINVFTPFSYNILNRIYLQSQFRALRLDTDGGYVYIYESPSFSVRPLEPFSDYHIIKREDIFTFYVDRRYGTDDWDYAYQIASANYGWRAYVADVIDNIIHVLFAPSWPDSGSDPDIHWLFYVGYYSRWMWMPLILLTLVGVSYRKLPERQMLFVGSTALLLLALFFQNTGTMEGRFRKPVEPMLLLSACIIAARRREGGVYTLSGHLRRYLRG